VSATTEQTATEIAELGRDALLDRLRSAFEEAAAAHADALALDDEQLEEMVQRADDEADGLQWRRALAAVATEKLGIGLGEALGHPAVARAHTILGVPSYEDSLARLEDPPTRAQRTAEHPSFADEREEDEDWDQDQGDDDPGPDADDDPEPHAIEHYDADSLRLRGVHLGGIADLESPEPGVELWFSDEGLDIIRPTKEPLGRLSWEELRALEVPTARGRFGRRRNSRAYLVIRGDQGDASFEIPGVTPDELREHLSPMLDEPM
jgi:hypothetical protein